MFTFAWCAPGAPFSPALKREDEQILGFEVSQSEGDFASLTIEIRNPRRNLLAGDVWAWLSEDDRPLFYGRLVASPENLTGEIVTLTLLARPADFTARKEALAAGMRVGPWFDPVWITSERVMDPDVVLETRAELWHIDRLTHQVSTSSILSGEDGTFIFGPESLFYEGLEISYGAPPLRRVRVESTVSWDQAAAGTIDATGPISAAAGGSGGVISSFTGQGLIEDWPEPNSSMGGSWTVGPARAERVDGTRTAPRALDVSIQPPAPDPTTEGSSAEAFVTPPYKARFYQWDIAVSLPLRYEVSRQRIEHVAFELDADVQAITTEAEDPETEIITASSQKVTEPDLSGKLPIGDVRRPMYIPTDRGRESLEYLMLLARAKLLGRARCVDVSFATSFENALAMSCRHSVGITDERIPNGEALGKIKAYSFGADGDGARFGRVTIGCTIGNGGAVVLPEAVPGYANDYVEEGWQFAPGQAFAPEGAGFAYEDLAGAEIDDDGIDLTNLDAASVVTRAEVTQGTIDQQRSALAGPFPDIAAAVEALNAVHTEICLELQPLEGGPFESTYQPGLTRLVIPRTLTL